MRIGRYAPFVLGGLFVLRVAACGPGTFGSGGGGGGGTAGGGRGGASQSLDGSTGGAPAPSGTCVDGNVVYGPNNESHACAFQDCWIDAATGSASCMRPSVANEPPFRTCRVAADCGGATYCEVFGQRSEMLLGGAICMNGVCDWRTKSAQSCGVGDQYCYPWGCQFYMGTTSGGFPWSTGTGTGPAGAGGTTGTGGTTSGGFPWGTAGATGTDAAALEDASLDGDATGG